MFEIIFSEIIHLQVESEPCQTFWDEKFCKNNIF